MTSVRYEYYEFLWITHNTNLIRSLILVAADKFSFLWIVYTPLLRRRLTCKKKKENMGIGNLQFFACAYDT